MNTRSFYPVLKLHTPLSCLNKCKKILFFLMLFGLQTQVIAQAPSITCAADQSQDADPGTGQAAVTVLAPTTSGTCLFTTITLLDESAFSGNETLIDFDDISVSDGVVNFVGDEYASLGINFGPANELAILSEFPPFTLHSLITVSDQQTCCAQSIEINFDSPQNRIGFRWASSFPFDLIFKSGGVMVGAQSYLPIGGAPFAGMEIMNGFDEVSIIPFAPVPFILDDLRFEACTLTVDNDFNNTDDASGTYPIGTTPVTWTVTDINGNSNTCVQNITVNDMMPEITCAADQSQDADPGTGQAAVTVLAPTTSGTCSFTNTTLPDESAFSGNETLIDFNDISVPPLEIINFEGDEYASLGINFSPDIQPGLINGSSSTTLITQQSFEINFDSPQNRIGFRWTSPHPFDLILKNGGINVGAQTFIPLGDPNFAGMEIMNGFDEVIIIPLYISSFLLDDLRFEACILTVDNDFNNSDDASGTYPIGTTPVTWTVTDIYGNSNTCVQNITVNDVVIPEITCAADQTQTVDPGLCEAEVTVLAPTTSGTCSFTNTTLPDESAFSGNETLIVFDELPVPPSGIGNFEGDEYASLGINFSPADQLSIISGGSSISLITITDQGYCCAQSFEINFDSPQNRIGFQWTSPHPFDLIFKSGGINVGAQTFIPLGNLNFAGMEIMNGFDEVIIIPLFTSPLLLHDLRFEACIMTVDNDFNNTDDASGTYSVGTTPVTWTVTDIYGNSNTCVQNIIVTDDENPTWTVAPSDLTVECDGSADPSGAFAAWLTSFSGSDNCGTATVSNNSTGLSDLCGATGTETVTFTLTDSSGNSIAADATFNIEDTSNPIAVCQDITVQLDDNGNVSITAQDIDGGSSDACGSVTYGASQINFDCDDVGENTVVLTLTDDCGNVSTCNAIVTVEDNVAPEAICQDITVQLDASGEVTIAEDAVNNGSSDACGGLTFDTDITSFDCDDVGANNITLTVTDIFGNVSICTAVATVVAIDADNDGFSICEGDCDDNDDNNYPNNIEVCDGQDNNCDGIIDEGFNDNDEDGLADCIDPDDDNDGIDDMDDNCPFIDNPGQEDLDLDGIGDACDDAVNVCDAIGGLIANVESLNLPNGMENALLSKLNNALNNLQNGNTNGALGKLNAFINQLNAQSGNQIDANDAAALIATTQAIIDAVNSGTSNCDSGDGEYSGNNDFTTVEVDKLPQLSEKITNNRNLENSDLIVYPNPVSNIMNIDVKGIEEAYSIIFFDKLGRPVWKTDKAMDVKNLILNISDLGLTSGLYQVILKSDNHFITKKVIVIK